MESSLHGGERKTRTEKSRGPRFRSTVEESGGCTVIDPWAGREGLVSAIKHPPAHGELAKHRIGRAWPLL